MLKFHPTTREDVEALRVDINEGATRNEHLRVLDSANKLLDWTALLVVALRNANERMLEAEAARRDASAALSHEALHHAATRSKLAKAKRKLKRKR